jgi:putative transposase
VTDAYRIIDSEEGNYPISSMCRWSAVSTSGFYEWKSRPVPTTTRRRMKLAGLIEALFHASDGTYGYRRVHADLARSGFHADDDTVRQIMRDLELVPCQPRPFRPVTTIAGDATGLPDLLRRDFTAVVPGTKLVGDITYIPTWDGWLYLATVLDCATKKVVGYAMADHMRTSLVLEALAMAARNITIIPDETIFHSDRGSQYTSQEFADFTATLKVRRSVGRTGVCYDNAWAESFNGTLKVERVNRTSYPTREHARRDIVDYIELRYNQRRLHSALGYITPNEAEQQWFDEQSAA